MAPRLHPQPLLAHPLAPQHPNAEQLLRGLVRDVPDFPKAGIIYKDITPLLASRRGLAASLDLPGDLIEAPAVGEDRLANGGQVQLVTAAFKQRHAQFVFQ